MIIEPATHRRELQAVKLNADLVVIGGGLSGTCGTITARGSNGKPPNHSACPA